MPSGSLPVVSYARISLDDDRDEHGVAAQHKVNRKTAAEHGWEIVCEFTDNDRSASKTNVVREDFERMLSALEAGRLEDGQPVSGTVVVAEDRLARRAGDYERFVEALTVQEGRVFADARNSKDLYSEDVEGMGLVGVAFSKIEARKIRRRMRHWHRGRAESGRSPGGTRPFGWQDDRTTKDPSEAPLLARAVEEFAAGRSLNSIVRDWQRRGVKTSLGNEWTARSLKITIGNPRVCGWRRLNGEIITDDDSQPVVGAWEPIVTPEQWMAVDAVINSRRGNRVTTQGVAGEPLENDFREHKYLLPASCVAANPAQTEPSAGLGCESRASATAHNTSIRVRPRLPVDAEGWGDEATRSMSSSPKPFSPNSRSVVLPRSSRTRGRARKNLQGNRPSFRPCGSSGSRTRSRTSCSSRPHARSRHGSSSCAPNAADTKQPSGARPRTSRMYAAAGTPTSWISRRSAPTSAKLSTRSSCTQPGRATAAAASSTPTCWSPSGANNAAPGADVSCVTLSVYS